MAHLAMDLTTGDGVYMYLTAHMTLKVESTERLSGGYCNFVWRAKLKAPYEGQNSVIVKYAAPFTSWDKTIELGVERLAFECMSLKMITSETPLLEENGLISVPAVYHYDSTANILVMQDIGSIATLHGFLRSNSPPTVPMAALIGAKLAAFIAGVHNWGRNNISAHARLSANIVGRTAMKKLCYETIVPKAAKSGVVDPLLPLVVAALSEEAMTNDETLVMGDFWTANVLIDMQESHTGEQVLKKLWIIDWESCRYGNPATDIASFAGDSYLVSRFQDHGLGEALRHSFLETYAALAKVDPLRVALGLGAHWIMWTDDLGRDGEAETRECVDKGLEYIQRAWDQSAEWVSLSLAKELVVLSPVGF